MNLLSVAVLTKYVIDMQRVAEFLPKDCTRRMMSDGHKNLVNCFVGHASLFQIFH